jgi:signal transduction histidine kinase
MDAADPRARAEPAPPPTARARALSMTARAMPNEPTRQELEAEIARLRTRERLMREVLDTIDASIVVYDDDVRYVLANRRYHETYPHLPPDEELAGLSFEDMLRLSLAAGYIAHAQAHSDPEAFVARRLAERRAEVDHAVERPRADGKWDLVTTRRMSDGGRVTLRVDITDQKHLQQELAKAKAEVEAVSEAKSRFIAVLGHELRTPLNAIIGFADLMNAGTHGPLGAPRYETYTADIAEAGRHLLSMVNDLLDLSKIQAGRMPVDEASIDLARRLRVDAALVDQKARANDSALEVSVPADLPALRADQRMVRQMVLNLLSNAAKFTRSGSIRVSASRRDDGGIDIVVADTGIGMAPDTLARLGEPFFQAARGAPADGGTGEHGTGLGLALVHEMMALHQGRLEIESRLGEGTTAVLHFPAERSA